MRHFSILFVLLCATPAFAQEAAPPEVAEASAPADDAKADDAKADDAKADDAKADDAKADDAKADDAKADDAKAESYDDAAEDLGLLVRAVQDKNWSLALGFILTLLVFGANKLGLKDRVGAKAVPWVATGVAIAATSGAAMVTGVSLLDAGVQGLLAGVVAIGGWEMLFKHFLKSKVS